tara:strand:+ start:381 stop:707 length:327 start_codon:yes stop_codon:yes gene_type:complete
MRCGKIIYPDATMAHNAMYAKKREGTKVNYYFCEYCNGYHLTSMTQAQQKEFKKSVKKAHELQKKKLKEIELGPFAELHDSWKELQKLKLEIIKNNEEIDKKVKEMLK